MKLIQLVKIAHSFSRSVSNLFHFTTLKCKESPLTPNLRGGGGGLFGPDNQIIECNSKTALSSTSKLGDF